MNVKNLLTKISATVVAICLFFCGAIFSCKGVQAAAATNVKEEFVDSVSELQTIFDDSALTFIPLLKKTENKDKSDVALVLRLNLKEGISDLSAALTKERLGAAVVHLWQNNYFLAIGDKDHALVDYDREEVLDLQPLFDLLTDSADDLLDCVNKNVENGVAKNTLDVSDYNFALEEQAELRDRLGFEFRKTQLLYTGKSSAQSAIGIDFYLTLGGEKEALSSLENIAGSFESYIKIDALKYEYKDMDLVTLNVKGDLTMKASADYTTNPGAVAAFAVCAAVTTKNETLKQSLTDGVKTYLTDKKISQLESAFDELSSAEILTAMKQFDAVPFSVMTTVLGIESDKALEAAAAEFGDMARMVATLSDSFNLSANEGKLRDHKTDGKYAFHLNRIDENGNKTTAEITLDLFAQETDLSALHALIAEIEKLDPTDYTTDSWKQVSDLIKVARAYTVTTPQTSVTLTILALNSAKKNLVKVEQNASSVPSDGESPNLLWLYITLPIVGVLLLGGAGAFFFLHRQRFADDTPIVQYDIEDDEIPTEEQTSEEAESPVAITEEETTSETTNPASDEQTENEEE